MLALRWHGKQDVRVETVEDPGIVNPRDAIVKVTSSAICGMDMHIYEGRVPAMSAGDILGHEFMGEVVEVGPASTLRRGQRVVVPSLIACGCCHHCAMQRYSACENGNPPEYQDVSQALYGLPGAARFGHGRIAGGYSGGQAEYVRVPFSDVGPVEVPEGVDDDRWLPLADTLPAGWQAAECAAIEQGDTVAVWGCGPVGLFAIQAAWLLGAGRIIAIDHHEQRLEQARRLGAEVVSASETNVLEALIDMTGGVGLDACIDAAGMDTQGTFFKVVSDPTNISVSPALDPSRVLHQAIMACRKGGRISFAGSYGERLDKFPLGALVSKGLILRGGHTDVQRYLAGLVDLIRDGRIDSAFVPVHRLGLEEAADAYLQFHSARHDGTRMVLGTGANRA